MLLGIALMPTAMPTSPDYPGTHCTLCDDSLLRHIRKEGIRWFCATCRQDMPRLESSLLAHLPTHLPAHPKPVKDRRDADESNTYQTLRVSQFSTPLS